MAQKRAARTDGDRGLPRAQPLPLFESFALIEPAVKHGEFVAEARPESRDNLMGQRNFGNQQQRLSSRVEDFLDRAQVNFGLSTARNPVEEEGTR